jgi:putative intracellular protease/amidase
MPPPKPRGQSQKSYLQTPTRYACSPRPWPSLKTDIRNAGADWVDQEVVVDENLVTSRKPDDIPAFKREIISLFGQVRH